MSHFILKGSCGHVIAQCRCPGFGAPKQERTSPEKCMACRKVESESEPTE